MSSRRGSGRRQVPCGRSGTTGETVLLLDVGNSRIKWATWRGGRLTRQRAAEYADWSTQDFVSHLFGAAAPTQTIIASVAGPGVERRLVAAAWQVMGRAPRFVRTSRTAAGLTTRYAEPWRLGVDRFMAAIAAHRWAGSRPVCVVGAGTAVTLDLVDGRGIHRGGAILPGPRLMVQSLLTSTAGIARRARGAPHGNRLFARSTAEAIEQGAKYAVAAAVERALDEARARLRQRPLLILTGGAAASLEPLIRTRHASVPNLVLRGVALYAGLDLRTR